MKNGIIIDGVTYNLIIKDSPYENSNYQDCSHCELNNRKCRVVCGLFLDNLENKIVNFVKL